MAREADRTNNPLMETLLGVPLNEDGRNDIYVRRMVDLMHLLNSQRIIEIGTMTVREETADVGKMLDELEGFLVGNKEASSGVKIIREALGRNVATVEIGDVVGEHGDVDLKVDDAPSVLMMVNVQGKEGLEVIWTKTI